MTKKILITLSIALILMSTTMISACAKQPAAEQEVQVKPAATAADVKDEEEKDAIVGAFKYPPNPYGDEFDSFIIFKEDGSFLYATNLYENGRGGAYTQQTRTNEDFYWLKTGGNKYELHEDYHDINGEFVTPLTYDAETDAIYMYGELYARRDSSFSIL